MSARSASASPLPGLPGPLPAGETLLWQGRPDWRVLARSAFHTGAVAAYFGVLGAWSVISALHDGRAPGAGLVWIVGLGLAALAVLTILAWLTARTTTYSITSRRVVLHFGVALPMTINLPFARVASASLRSGRDGSGDVPLALAGSDKVAYPILWPHARPWRISRPEPMLRALPDVGAVAAILAGALADAERIRHPDGVPAAVQAASPAKPRRAVRRPAFLQPDAATS